MLATHQRQAFTDDLEKAIGASGVKPYVKFHDLTYLFLTKDVGLPLD